MIPSKRLPLILFWLVASLGVTSLLVGAVAGFDKLWQPQLTIPLYNSFFVVSYLGVIGIVWVPMLLVVGFLLLLRSWHPLQMHIVLALVSALLIGTTTCLIALPTTTSMGGSWTIYPPLDTKEIPFSPPVNPYQPLLNGVYVLQLLAVVTLGYSSYRVGRLVASR